MKTVLTQDELYMKEALRQAKKAYALKEVPIGCVIVRHEKDSTGQVRDRIIARGYNRRNTDHDVLSHAETNALKKAAKAVGDWRLEDCTLYVTLEPCQMCAGAIVQARVGRVVIGAMNPKAGCAGSVINLLQMQQFNHQVKLEKGVLQEECSKILTDFFQFLRAENGTSGRKPGHLQLQMSAPVSGQPAADDANYGEDLEAGFPNPTPIYNKKEGTSGHGRRRRVKHMDYKVLLWDIDGTLLNFLAAEREALKSCFRIFDMGECTDEMIQRYSAINRRHWEALERGEMTKQQVLVGRYEEFFAAEGLDVSKAAAFNDEYQLRLGDTIVYSDDSYAIVQKLKGHVLQYAVSNGTRVAQERKLAGSGFDKLLDGIFISDIIGHEKPSVEFFAPVFEELKKQKEAGNLPDDFDFSQVLIIGDSLTSDIRGGNNAGIAACWYNPGRLSNDKGVKVDYEITNLHQVIPMTGVHFKQGEVL